MILIRLTLISLLLSLTACTSLLKEAEEVGIEEPIEEVEPGRTPKSKRVSPVEGLLNQAKEAQLSGNIDAAAGILERALRLDRRNPYVWHYMAKINLMQDQYAQVESMALRSNNLSRGNYLLQSENWALIELARRSVGDSDGARQAAEKSLELKWK
jgi:tetratricopeptide (TPR) repeat protein